MSKQDWDEWRGKGRDIFWIMMILFIICLYVFGSPLIASLLWVIYFVVNLIIWYK